MHVEERTFDRQEINNILSVYGTNAVMVDGINPDRKSGFFTITSESAHSLFAPEELTVDTLGIGHLEITEAHCAGHFDSSQELPLVFPGYGQVDTAVHTLAKLSGQPPALNSIGSVFFQRAVHPGDQLDIMPLKDGEKINVALLKSTNGELISMINDLHLTSDIQHDDGMLSNSILIETAAQTLGLIYSLKENIDLSASLPLFQKMGMATWNRVVHVGEDVKVIVESMEERKNGFSGNTILKVGEKIIAEIKDIHCLIANRQVAKKLFPGRM